MLVGSPQSSTNPHKGFTPDCRFPQANVTGSVIARRVHEEPSSADFWFQEVVCTSEVLGVGAIGVAEIDAKSCWVSLPLTLLVSVDNEVYSTKLFGLAFCAKYSPEIWAFVFPVSRPYRASATKSMARLSVVILRTRAHDQLLARITSDVTANESDSEVILQYPEKEEGCLYDITLLVDKFQKSFSLEPAVNQRLSNSIVTTTTLHAIPNIRVPGSAILRLQVLLDSLRSRGSLVLVERVLCENGSRIRFPNTLPDTLLFVLSGFFWKIFILQLVELVLTYDFTRCNFRNFTQEYDKVIYPELKKYVNQSQCFNEIVRHTFNPDPGCASLAEETFAILTKTSLTRRCPGYTASQVNNTQTTTRKKREVKTNGCLGKALYLIELWHRFTRILRKQNKLSLTETK
ncbi:PREDICTED: uncharacterized protein LOC102841966 [Chrysochloris asiatica]|uniref:Uncharacterized protein LOC102841966 n=1 Tax=Chrysochloris asiatica TaxID=185453 RepID=A0A9B0U9L2_CHRAS|nr:PREDICTED: uncharacterized protein LOC102841966 [Chrysochloris asiatica]